MAIVKEDFIKEVESMTVLELNELVEALKEKFGVSAVAVAGGSGASGGDGSAAAEEKSTFDVILKESGPNKIAVIKEIKAITGLGLKESKDFADNPGKAIKEGLEKAAAEEMKKKLESAGAVVELK